MVSRNHAELFPISLKAEQVYKTSTKKTTKDLITEYSNTVQ